MHLLSPICLSLSTSGYVFRSQQPGMCLFVLCKYFLQWKVTYEVWWFSQSTVLWHVCTAWPAWRSLKAEEVLNTAAAFTTHQLFNWPKKPPAQQFYETDLLPSWDQTRVADNLFFLAFKENNKGSFSKKPKNSCQKQKKRGTNKESTYWTSSLFPFLKRGHWASGFHFLKPGRPTELRSRTFQFLQSFRKPGDLPDIYGTSQTRHQDHRTGVYRGLGFKKGGKKKRNKCQIHQQINPPTSANQQNSHTTKPKNSKRKITSIKVRLIDV